MNIFSSLSLSLSQPPSLAMGVFVLRNSHVLKTTEICCGIKAVDLYQLLMQWSREKSMMCQVSFNGAQHIKKSQIWEINYSLLSLFYIDCGGLAQICNKAMCEEEDIGVMTWLFPNPRQKYQPRRTTDLGNIAYQY